MMMSALLILVVSFASAITLKDLYPEIKRNAKTWEVADPNDLPFSDMSLEDLASIFPMDPMLSRPTLEQFSSKTSDSLKSTAPISFDSREKWPDCIHEVRNQGPVCGSCYAHGSSEVLSDRLCIHSEGKINVTLSVQDAVSCGRLICNGCFGCVYPYLWLFWRYYGGVTEECFPYSATEEPCAIANNKCKIPGVEFKKYFIKKGSERFPYKDNEMVKQEIMTNGPVSAVMFITPDYMYYKGGVFVPATNEIIGSHLFKIIGWGVDSLTKLEYWLVQDSQGKEFGENGYARIKIDVLGIDSHMSWAMPEF